MMLATAPLPAKAPAEAPPVDWVSRVRGDILASWQAYEKTARGHDELRPVSKTARDWYGESLLMTPVDALDTLILAGFDDEAALDRELIDTELSFDKDVSVQVFEVTIRLLGGLLSGYQLTGDEHLLHLADDLGTRLLPAFASPTGMPYRFVNLATGKTTGARSNPAEIGTLLLEFGTLSKLTGKPVYWEKAKKAVTELYRRRSKIGLVGDQIDVETGEWAGRSSHVGGGIDSYYEYLLKCARLFGDGDCRSMWTSSVAAVNRYLADETPAGLWYGVSDMETGKRTQTEFGALQAFFPAVLALSGDPDRARRVEAASFAMWNLHHAEPDGLDYESMKVTDPHYPLRPEIAESAYYLFHFTHDERYRQMGETILGDLEGRCRAGGAFTVLDDVTTGKQGDLMPSYFLAETLKYLYLLFARPATLDFDGVVFNTEGHPLRRTW